METKARKTGNKSPDKGEDGKDANNVVIKIHGNERRPRPVGDMSLPIKALALAITIAVLLKIPNVKLIQLDGSNPTLMSFISFQFLFDFIAVYFIATIYDLTVAGRMRTVQSFYGALFSSIILSMGSLITFSTPAELADSCIILFLAFYAGFWICNRKRAAPVLKFFAVIFVALLILELVINAKSLPYTGPALQAVLQGFQGLLSTIGSISNNFAHGHETSPTTLPFYGNGATGSRLTNASNSQTTSPPSGLFAFALSVINMDRARYGLSNVTLSSITSGQQHAASMLTYGYFSHWDTYGMKPYMRYTLLNGRGAVSENIATESSKICSYVASISAGCSGDLNATQSITEMEYNMMYNDSACCQNGHRDNILDPNHNQVSIGIAYNSSAIFLVEDFINNYVIWNTGMPSYASGGTVSLSGATLGNFQVSSIEVSYDSLLRNMSISQLSQTSSYGYGSTIAGVVSNSNLYYPNITTIVAERYASSGNAFDIAFSIQNLIKRYGAGEYTIILWLNASGSPGRSFIGSTYTVFINGNGLPYTPQNI